MDWLAWLQRWRPCVPPPTLDGKTIEQWRTVGDERAFEIATMKRVVEDRDRTIDDLARRIENLTDLIRDTRRLLEREGV